MTQFHIGTSGFSFKEWKGSFYPEDLPERLFLNYYGEHFSTVEINNTFHRMPKRELLARWRKEVPPQFVFILKAPQRITHMMRLEGIADAVHYFLETAAELGPQLGPLLFQLPPYLPKNVGRLRGLLSLVPPGQRVALEFRHASWHDDEIYALLREHSAALCCSDSDASEEAAPLVKTAPWAYLRLRRETYEGAALRGWATKAREYSDAFVFFKHEQAGAGPRVAAEFASLVDEEPTRLARPSRGAARSAAARSANEP